MTLTEFNEAEFVANRRAEGRAEGRAETLVENIDNLVQNLGMSLEAACKVLGYPIQMYEESKHSIE